MPTTYVPTNRARAFEKEFGEAKSKTVHGKYTALHYDEIPKDVVNSYGGGWYWWKGRTQGKEAAFLEAGRNF